MAEYLVGDVAVSAMPWQQIMIGIGALVSWCGAYHTWQQTDLVIVKEHLNGQQNVDKILHLVIAPFAGIIGRNFDLQDDNPDHHRLSLTKGMQTLKWPLSPEMSPIEHLWEAESAC